MSSGRVNSPIQLYTAPLPIWKHHINWFSLTEKPRLFVNCNKSTILFHLPWQVLYRRLRHCPLSIISIKTLNIGFLSIWFVNLVPLSLALWNPNTNKETCPNTRQYHRIGKDHLVVLGYVGRRRWEGGLVLVLQLHLVLSLEEVSCVITGGGNHHCAIFRPTLASGYNIIAVQYGNLRLVQTFATFSQGYSEEGNIYMLVAISINIKSITWLNRIKHYV